MRKLLIVLALAAMTAGSAMALNPGQDVIVPAAGRGDPWVTDLYVLNPGTTTVSVTVAWLVRNQANPNPNTITFSLPPGATEVLDDVILNDFGQNSGNGAFRVTATGEVVVNSRIYATDGPATLGQGFEGVPVWAATGAGTTAGVVGLSFNSGFRTNIYATAGADGATITFRLVDPDAVELASRDISLEGWEPYLRRVDQVFQGIGNFDDATLTAEVTAGSAVVGASKVDNASADPTTLESSAAGGGGIDGTYQFALYDQATFATGGNIEISSGQVTAINGTYTNWDKVDGGGNSVCTLLFLWGLGLTPASLEDFATGVTFSDSYQSTGSGVMTWTVEFAPGDGATLEGSVTAVGSEFTAPDEGCNGDFPPLVLYAGKGSFPPVVPGS